VVEQHGSEPAIAVVTGAGSGIGASVVTALANRGYLVTGLDREFASDAGRAEISQAVCDVRDAAECAAVIDGLPGHIDVLVNAAAVRPECPLLDTDLAAWRTCLDVNLTGTFIMMRAVASRMRKQNSSCIVNVSSAAAYGKKGLSAYGASKAGMISLTMTAAQELGSMGIRVNAVLPGTTATRMLDEVGMTIDTPSPRNLSGYPMPPDSVAETIVSSLIENTQVTGAILPVGLLPAEW